MTEQYRRPGTKSIRVLALFPGALGDLLCALPALRAIRPATLVVRGELFDLLADEAVDLVSIDRREIADFFGRAPIRDSTQRAFAGHTHVHSWLGDGDENFRERLAAVTGGDVSIHALRGMRTGEHASLYFARCVDLPGAPHVIEPPSHAAEWALGFWSRNRLGTMTLAVHPGSGSRRKNWEGMIPLAEAWKRSGGQVLAIVGPAEADASPFQCLPPSAAHAAPMGVASLRFRVLPPSAAHAAPMGVASLPFPCDALISGEPLARVAAALRRAHRYVGNDSGISHLAGCLGVGGVAVFGPTDPVTWRPQGTTLRVVHAPTACASCGPERFCTHRLPSTAVLAALGEVDPFDREGGHGH